MTNSSEATRPNVVFIVGDNVGWGDIGCSGGLAPTPRLDALAGQGLRFRNYNVEAQCTPTRSALISASSGAATTAATGSSVAPANEELCADREALRTSVDALKDIDLVAEGTNGVKSAVTAVKDDLAALRASAGDELKPQVDAVQGNIDDLEAAIEQLGSGGAAAAVSAVSSLVSSAGTLLDELQAGGCGGATTTT